MKNDKSFVTESHFNAILPKCDTARLPRDQHFTAAEFWQALLATAWVTGMRRGALLSLLWEGVNLSDAIAVSRHRDNKPNGGAVLHCHAGCGADAVCAAMGLQLADLMPARIEPTNGKAKSQIVAAYDYRDESDKLLFHSVRFDPKGLRQRRPKPGGGWTWTVKGVRVVPYQLPKLLA